jgi:malonate-semialdehyde dehydrogenase (acetylating)/methylmalonate-semialdehyde dehydrogenase
MKTLGVIKNYVNGQWVEAENTGYINVDNPSTGKVITKVPLSTSAETNRAIEAAHAAFPSWSEMPVARRVLYIEVACGMPVLQQGDKLISSSFDIDGEVIRLPLGVFGMIAPFNFPAMVPFWFIPYALAAGNTYVVKASKQVPCTMQLITRYMDETGLPPGVFNLVNGDKTVANSMMDSPLVKGVSMVGSTAVCRQVAEKCARTNKRFQAMGSAKNHLVVMPDARIEDTIRNMISSCYGCAGQRCMAASAIVCVGDRTYRTICDKFVAA